MSAKRKVLESLTRKRLIELAYEYLPLTSTMSTVTARTTSFCGLS